MTVPLHCISRQVPGQCGGGGGRVRQACRRDMNLLLTEQLRGGINQFIRKQKNDKTLYSENCD